MRSETQILLGVYNLTAFWQEKSDRQVQRNGRKQNAVLCRTSARDDFILSPPAEAKLLTNENWYKMQIHILSHF